MNEENLLIAFMAAILSQGDVSKPAFYVQAAKEFYRAASTDAAPASEQSEGVE